MKSAGLLLRGSQEGPAASPLQCIYCRSLLPPSAFNREHVVPYAFAPFKNSLVLHNKVCSECNHYFSRTVDLALARSSPEGLERYRWGVTSPSKLDQFKYISVKLRLKEPGDFENALFELRPGNVPGGIVSRLVPQVAVRNVSSDGFTWFSEKEAARGEWLSRTDIDWKRGIKLMGDSTSLPRLQRLVAAQGVAALSVHDLLFPLRQGDDVTVEHEFRITDEVARAIAKIAFNYLSYIEGAQLVLGAAFDPVRGFIRNGVPTIPPTLHSDWEDVLPYTKADANSRPVIHFVGITGHHDHTNLLGTVTLFGFMRHIVLLAVNLQSFPVIPYGHHFHVSKKEVTPQPVRDRIIPRLDPH